MKETSIIEPYNIVGTLVSNALTKFISLLHRLKNYRSVTNIDSSLIEDIRSWLCDITTSMEDSDINTLVDNIFSNTVKYEFYSLKLFLDILNILVEEYSDQNEIDRINEIINTIENLLTSPPPMAGALLSFI